LEKILVDLEEAECYIRGKCRELNCFYFKEVRVLRLLWRSLIVLGYVIVFAIPNLAQGLAETQFMRVDQIKAGMVGVGKTVFSGTQIEEFQVEILGVLKQARPRGDIILARFSGGPLAQSGLIQGMSGSPIYIEGKLIGAQAYGWAFSTQPIGGITPIEEMLDLWHRMDADQWRGQKDIRAPDQLLDFEFGMEEVLLPGQLWADHAQLPAARPPALVPLETPVMLSGFDQRVVAQMAPFFEKYGMTPIQAGSMAQEESLTVSLEAGVSLAVQLVRGDISVSALGTLTYREGDRIIGFGHPMFYAGDVNFPITGAYVHSVMPSQAISFKLASVTKELGVLRQDRRSGVAGNIGQNPSMIPIRLAVHYQDGAESEKFFFEIIDNKFFSPGLVTWTTLNALLTTGKAVGDVTMALDARIAIHGYPDLEVKNLFAGATPQTILAKELGEIIGLLLQNDLEEVSLREFSLDISVENRRRTARISSARANKQTVRPGEEVQLTVFLEPYRGEEQTLRTTIRVPDDAPEGELVLRISDATASMLWEQKRAPHRFRFHNLAQILDILKKIEHRDELIVKLVMPRSGAVIKGQELPSLPPSALAVLRGSHQEGEGGMTHEVVLQEKRLPARYVLSGQVTLPILVKR